MHVTAYIHMLMNVYKCVNKQNQNQQLPVYFLCTECLKTMDLQEKSHQAAVNSE